MFFPISLPFFATAASKETGDKDHSSKSEVPKGKQSAEEQIEEEGGEPERKKKQEEHKKGLEELKIQDKKEASEEDKPDSGEKHKHRSESEIKNAIDEAAEGDGKDDVVIRVTDLKKGFGSKKILDGLTVELKRGQNLAVMGKSGTGKSVLIKCIVRLLEPDSGKIEVFGQDMDDMNSREIDDVRLHIGFLFQSGALYDSMTVRENMEFPLRRHRRDMSDEEVNEAVEGVLKSVGLSHAIDKMPGELSGGMKKRAGLARTLILKPDIMLYDEPTTGLDTATSHEISDLINSVRDEYNVSSMIITHDLPCAKTCADQIMILKDGKCGALGTYEELAESDDEFVRSLFH